MSGHSKFANIKHKKEKNDAAKGKIFTIIGREIAVAVKEGGPDPSNNYKLAQIIAKAKSNNMPNDTIERGIKKAAGDDGSVNYEYVTYEGYGPNGIAIIVEALTDNKNRTASDVRHYFDKFGGGLGTTGCVSYMFNRKGVMIVAKGTGISDDDMMMIALDCGAEDIEIFDEFFQIYTTPETLDSVKANLEEQNIKIAQADVDLIPQNYVSVPEDKLTSFGKLMNALNDNDDVQEVYHNVDNYEE